MNPERWHETIPVPDALERRIRASVARRRGLRFAAAAAVLAAGLAFLLRPSAPPPVAPAAAAFAVSLAAPAPEPLRMQEVRFSTDIDAAPDTLIIHLGGPSDD
jgi:hypothetical protein